MADSSLGTDKSLDKTIAGERISISSIGMSPVHIHPNTGVSSNNLEFPVQIEQMTLSIYYTQGAVGFALDITDGFTIVDIGTETIDGLSRVHRDVVIQPSQENTTSSPISGALTINFINYMGLNTVTIVQNDAPRITSLFATGAGLTGAVDASLTSIASRSTFTGSDTETDTISLIIGGDDGASYTLTTDNSALFTGADLGQTFVKGAGNASHTITVAIRGTESIDAFIRVTNTVTSETITLFLQQVGDNVPQLSIFATSSLTPVRGQAVTYDWTVTGADNGAGVLERSNTQDFSSPINTVASPTVVGGAAAGSASVTPLTAGTRYFRFTDSGGRTSSIAFFDVTPATPIMSADAIADTWNDQTISIVFDIAGLNTSQLATLGGSDFELTQLNPVSPALGTIGATSLQRSTSVVTHSVTNRTPNTSLTTNLVAIYRIRLSVGSVNYDASITITKGVRPPNLLTFPNSIPTLAFDDTEVTFTVRRDIGEPSLSLSDTPSNVADDDIWTNTRLGAAVVGSLVDAGLTSDINSNDFYLSDSTVMISQGSTNTTLADLMDQIVVTSS